MNIGKNIRNLRLKHDMSMRDLAEKLEVTDSTICRWENERMKLSLDDAVKIADLFQVTLNELAE